MVLNPFFNYMLFLIFFDYKFFVNMQAGFYVDFFIKKLAEIFIRNFLVYTSLFFGEKYMIEVLTKKIIDNFVIEVNKFLGWTVYNYIWFFVITISILLYFFIFINIFLLIF